MVRITDIPNYLCSSELYKSLLEETPQEGEDRGHFDVPDGHLKQDRSVHCEQDARHLLTTLRYWGIGGIYDTIATYLMNECRNPDEGERLVAEFGREFPYLEAFSKMVESSSMLERFGSAVSVGSIEVLEYLRRREKRETGEDSFLKLADIDVGNLCAIAASNNQLECLKYMLRVNPKRAEYEIEDENGAGAVFIPPEFNLRMEYLNKNEVLSRRALCISAAAGGHIECLRFLRELNFPQHASVCSAAAGAGKLECLQYLHDTGCPWDKDTCTAAAAGDHLDCLQYVLERGCPLGDICIAAASAGSLACLQYAHEHGVKWDERVTRDAAKFGHQACLEYALNHGCPYEGMPQPVLPVAESRWAAWFSGCWTRGAVVHPEAIDGRSCNRYDGWLRRHSRDSTPRMERVRLHDIPAYLRSSELYRSLVEGVEEDEEGDEFDVPAGALKADDRVHSLQDARDLLSTLRYWGVGAISEPIVSYLIQSSEELEEIQPLVNDFGNEFRYLEAFVKMRKMTSAYEKLEVAISVGVISVIEYIRAAERVKSGDDILKRTEGTIEDRMCAIAAAHNHLECLEYLCSQGLKCGRLCCFGAAENGHLDILHFLKTQGCKWDAHVCATAAGSGSLACLQYLHEEKCPWDKWTCYHAAQNNHLPCLQYAHEHGCEWTVMTCVIATKKGNLDCLRYAHEHGCSLIYQDNLMHICVQAGQLACLKYLHGVGQQWKASVCAFAAAANQLECLQYAHEHGCPWDEVTCSAAAGEGNLECLQYARKQGCPWDTRTTRAAAQTRNTACLVYAVGNGCPCDADSLEILHELLPDSKAIKPAPAKSAPFLLRCVRALFAQQSVQSAATATSAL